MTRPIPSIQTCYNIVGCVPYAETHIPVTKFITEILYLLIPFSYFVCPPILSLLETTSFFFFIYECFCFMFVFIFRFHVEGRSWASQVVLVVKNLPSNAGDERNIG